MNIDKFRNLGLFLKGDDLQVGTIGLMGNPSFNNEDVQDVLVLACSCDKVRFSEFINKNGAICIAVYTDDQGHISKRLLGSNDFKDDWVYVPESKPNLMVKPNTRRKSRFAKQIATRNSIYLSDDGGACLFLSSGTIDLKKMHFTHVQNHRENMMSINEWGFFETLHNSSKPFWP